MGHLGILAFAITCTLPVFTCIYSAAAPPQQKASFAGLNPAEIPGIDTLVDAAAKHVRRTENPSRIAAFEDVRDVMADASQWRWYSRDNGILLAIPVRERLGIPDKVEGERELADVVRRLLNQAGWGNPAVRVLLVEPDEPVPARPSQSPCETIPLVNPCQD